jgi:chromosome segregation protein
VFVEKLSLFGFKSFNQRVSLEFGSGISGVIGPNGCGKSNIVDAIRWVLGEQSTKQLRGAKMEDVIFNGSRDEKPLSIAEVELTLNNDRGRLPIEYGTVTVGRRLYRSGLSEYTINKQPVRLKDVRDLFLDTGMGSHAYSVIERQMVDNILSDTTGHRRFLFEEAAGIMKYKTRKKEALTKLEATERDLLRVNDIITEVERQVGSLHRQVGKARRYQELMTEIRGIDLAHSQVERRRWVNEIDGLAARHADALRQAESGETEVATLEARLQELHLEVLEEERSLSEARELLAQVDDELGRANNWTVVLRERLSAYRDRIKESQDLQVRLADRLDRNASSNEEVSARLEDLGSRETTEREHLEERERDLAGADARVRSAREGVIEAKQVAVRRRDERIRAEGEVAASGKRLEDLEGRLAAIEARLGGARVPERDSAAALEAARANVAAARRRAESFEEARRALDARREDWERRSEDLRTELGAARQSDAAARSRLQTLEGLRERYEGFDPGVRALMLAEGRDPGVRGTVGDLLRLPADWVPALEPALSTVWQVVVVDDTDAARRLVGRLKGEALGYATLIPLDRVPATEVRDGGLVWASEVIESDPAYRDLVRYLFGDLALVDDLDEAMRVVGEGRARRAATRAGQLVDGAAMAGGEGGPAGAELVERLEGLDRCRREIDDLLRALGALTQREQSLRQEREIWEREAESLGQDLAGAQHALSSLEKEEAALGLELRHAGEAVSGLEDEQRRLADSHAALRDEQGRQTVTRDEAGRLADEADVALAALETVQAEAETERERVLTGVHEMKMVWARIESELRDAHASVERLDRERTDLTGERERAVRDEADALLRVEETERELGETGERIDRLHRQRDERQGVVNERERARSDAFAREQQDTDAVREVRRRAAGHRETVHAAELRLSELRGDLRHLEERLYQDYEITAEGLDGLEIGEIPEDASVRLNDLRDRLKRIGPVNLLAVEEYEEKKQRFDFMSTQRDDLLSAKDSLMKTIEQINKTAAKMFTDTFALVQANFQKTFQVLFQGGECSLSLVGDDPLEADIDVTARPRGKRPQSIAQLSSGERALTAIALLFAIYLVKPSPFCILDEVDAPLDDANIDRFVAMVKEFSKRTQFIVITHNKKTMEASDCLYGVTMQKPGVSSVVSVRLDGLRAEEVAARTGAALKREGNGRGSNGGQAESEEPLSPESVIVQ